MKIRVTVFDADETAATVFAFAEAKSTLTPEARALDERTDGAIANAVGQSAFTGARGQTLTIAGLEDGALRVVLVGLGEADALDESGWREVGIAIGKKIDKLAAGGVAIAVGATSGPYAVQDAAAPLVEGLHLALYTFDRYQTKTAAKRRPIPKITIAVDYLAVDPLRRRATKIASLMAGSALARDLVNQPPNVVFPRTLAAEARKLAKDGIEVEVLGPDRLRKLGMNLMLAVGDSKEAALQPRLIVLRWSGAAKKAPLTAVVGKGVTFDSGGYGIKSSAGMRWMKSDMAGSAAVLGLMKALALRKSKANVVGVCGCVVNLIAERTFLPGAVYTAFNGKTVEIEHTDAEGRLVLADAMAYIVKEAKPRRVIDIATLTGACSTALGGRYAGLFSTSDEMADALLAAGRATGERLWRLPIDDEYAAKSTIADLANAGVQAGGASSAAVFLKNFAGKTPWAHLDIAGVAMREKVPNFLPLKGATGFGVRLLVDYLEADGGR